MRHKIIMLAVACIVLPASCLPASSQSAPDTARVSRAEQIARASKPLFGWPALVEEARKYIGTNPTARKRLWCATFMNMILSKVGYSGTQSDAAKSFAYYGRRISEPQVGAIAVLTRGKNGGHVGVVTGVDDHGNPVIISGNHNRRVGQAIYPRSRVIAYVMPSGAPPTVQLAARRSAPRQAAGQAAHQAQPAEQGLVSPIEELFAAIEAEQERAERQRALRARQAAARHAVPAQRTQATVPHRVVQQAPDDGMDPALAEFLGLREREPAARRMPPRQPRAQVPARSRVAADSGLAGLFGFNNTN